MTMQCLLKGTVMQAYFLTVSIIFSIYEQNCTLNNLKTRTAINANISVFVVCVETVIYLSLYNLHDCTFKELNQFFICSKKLQYQNTVAFKY